MSFHRERTLAAHTCEPKRRAEQESEPGVRLGFMAYLRFYEITQGSAKLKTYNEFSTSSFYLAFVKFGRYMVDIRCVNATAFTDWLLKNNKKIDFWCSDSLYDNWLYEYLRREPPQDALERALKEMQAYADKHPDIISSFNDYFKDGNANRIIHHITTGRISPWVIFNCDSGIEFLETLTEDQVTIIIRWIDPEYWQRRFRDFMADAEWTRDILTKAGM